MDFRVHGYWDYSRMRTSGVGAVFETDSECVFEDDKGRW